MHLKPRRGSFLFPRIVGLLFLSLIVGATTSGVLFGMEKAIWPGPVVFAVLFLWGVINVWIAYQKERYEIHATRLICHSGGLWRDHVTELEIHNITQVKLRLPWIRHMLFGIGTVQIESAGNAVPIFFSAIRQPREVYDVIRQRMREQGYELTAKELLHHQRPALIGLLMESARMIFWLLIISAGIFSKLMEITEDSDPLDDSPVLPLLLGLAAVGVVLTIVLRFCDFRRRNYRVYRDMVEYEEGFMTREYAFIPYENLADATTQRSFLDRVLGLYQVKLSCQGAGREIAFAHLRRGEELFAVVHQLVLTAREKLRQKREGAQREAAAPVTLHEGMTDEPPALPPVREPMVAAEYRMHTVRAILPWLVLFPIFPFSVFLLLPALIASLCTRYSLLPGLLRYHYRFLAMKQREFAYDKITGLVIRTNPWDRLFGTATLRFWSLGSEQAMDFQHVRMSEVNLPALKSQLGIAEVVPEPWCGEFSFSFALWLRAHLWGVVLMIVALLAAVVAGSVYSSYFYLLIAVVPLLGVPSFACDLMRTERQELHLHPQHVEAVHGLILRSHYFVRYTNIKRTARTLYPGGNEGSLMAYVAGEIDAGAKNGQKVMRPCMFQLDYLKDAESSCALLLDVICGRIRVRVDAAPAPATETLLESPRALPNAIAAWVILSMVLLPMAALLPVTLPWRIMAIRRWRYTVDEVCVVVRHGILFRKKISLPLDRIDSLQRHQGPLNKMFRNGGVLLMTAGSSTPDMVLVDSPMFADLYAVIRERSQVRVLS
jgi:uncharacterized membrane protein YdbT with pleckstrin-like domain